MIESGIGQKRVHRHDVPRIEIVSGCVVLAVHPATVFEVALVAGDIADASLTVRSRKSEDPLITLDARAGGVTRFIPAAPTVIRGQLQIQVIGEDAVGSIAYR